MKVEEKENLNGDKKLKYTHIQNNSNKVCFMFSGSGYTFDKPLFYYSTMKLIEDKVDIIHVHYNYSKNVLNLPITKLAKVITSDVYPIVEDVSQVMSMKKSHFWVSPLELCPLSINY